MCVWVGVFGCVGERETETDTQRDRQIVRDREGEGRIQAGQTI